MAENKNISIIDVDSRPIIRNWIIKISDIRRIYIRKNEAGSSISTHIEIRYNGADGYKTNEGFDQLDYPADKVVTIFYSILKCLKRCKKPKDDFLIITENDVYLLSETNITGI